MGIIYRIFYVVLMILFTIILVILGLILFLTIPFKWLITGSAWSDNIFETTADIISEKIYLDWLEKNI